MLMISAFQSELILLLWTKVFIRLATKLPQTGTFCHKPASVALWDPFVVWVLPSQWSAWC